MARDAGLARSTTSKTSRGVREQESDGTTERNVERRGAEIARRVEDERVMSLIAKSSFRKRVTVKDTLDHIMIRTAERTRPGRVHAIRLSSGLKSFSV